jgi:hypothetical protein
MTREEKKKVAEGFYELSRYFLELGRSVLTIDDFVIPPVAQALALRVEELNLRKLER